jgi:nitronate monooxygenase
MAGFAGGNLAATVTLSGGLGMIGSMNDMNELRKELRIAKEKLTAASTEAKIGTHDTLPLGVGFLPFITKLDEALPVLREYKPTVVWLFAAKELGEYVEWAEKIRAVTPNSKIWVQVGSVSAALTIAKTVQPAAICLQGADAGGHGFEKGAGIITLFPEAEDAFKREGITDVALLASGGIVDGRGVAAALALGAQGVIVGTRFLTSNEINIHPKYQAAILEARDGSQVTTRSKLFDELKGPSIWPKEYDGRSLVIQSYVDYADGLPIDEIRRLHAEALSSEDKGYDTGLNGRAAIWAGSGVGLANELQPAADIVESLRKEATVILKRTYERVA